MSTSGYGGDLSVLGTTVGQGEGGMLVMLVLGLIMEVKMTVGDANRANGGDVLSFMVYIPNRRSDSHKYGNNRALVIEQEKGMDMERKVHVPPLKSCSIL
ncbi:hypothetical protein ACP8HI_06025 [Paenibacillus sp. FA6]|uniref:hypothetical protein n=1 Tax=Paenibacillus sp. FA6 TaxID=3413029 RepID=UPI003F65570C